MTEHTLWQRSVPLHQLQILVLDESPDARAETRAALRSAGAMQIAEASFHDGGLAGAHLPASQLDVIISDVDLGSVNGLMLLKAIRLGRIRGLRPNLCFILFTRCTDSVAVTTAARLDANGYLVRPTSLERIRSAVVKGAAKRIVPDQAKYMAVTVPAFRVLPRRPLAEAARPSRPPPAPSPAYTYVRTAGRGARRDGPLNPSSH